MGRLEKIVNITRERMNRNELNMNKFVGRVLTVIGVSIGASAIALSYHKLAETHPEYLEATKEFIKYLFH